MTEDAWLKKHPYLQPLAYVHAQVTTAAAEITDTYAHVPIWDNYLKDFHSGIPLLHSSSFALELESVGTITKGIVERLVSTRLPGRLADESRALHADLCGSPDRHGRIPDSLISGDSIPSGPPGLLRYIGWTALASYLHPVVNAFAGWRDEEKWLRNYCPTCGSAPTMARLAGTDPARQRFLCCGCCGTRWWYRRTACPFCDNNDDRQLSVLSIEGENGLRIDHCKSCGGYLKTYAGNSSEDFFLTEWTSIHLDIIALDHGLKRLATSLYEA